MEELIRKLTEAIADFNRYIQNEYSAINKNYSGISNSLGDYSIFKIVNPKLLNFKINKTFPRANFISVKINNSTDVVYITTNTTTKEKLAFRDGSRYEGIFSDLYLSYDFSSYGIGNLPDVEIFIGYNSKFIPITSVKIADIDSSNPLPISVDDQKPVKYLFKSYGGSINNQLQTIVLTEQNISSIIVSNNGQNGTLYIGEQFDGSNYETLGMPILEGEKFSVDFNPLAKDNVSFKLFSPDNIKYSILVKFKQTLL